MSQLNANSVELGSLTTTQRDALSSPETGTLIYNSTLGVVQVYNGSSWDQLSNLFTATGGTKNTTSRSGYVVHTFTGPVTFEVQSGNATVEYLVQGAGGAGEDVEEMMDLVVEELVH